MEAMQDTSEGSPLEESPQNDANSASDLSRRKHRPGLHRTQIACQRCRTRKNKCDGKLPVCSNCEKAEAPCIVVDRMTYRQHPRGHMSDLEALVVTLQNENKELKDQLRHTQSQENLSKQQLETMRHENQHLRDQLQSARESMESLENSPRNVPSINNEHQQNSHSSNLPEDIGLLSLEGVSQGKYVGDSSGIHFGKIIQAVLPTTDYKHEQGPSHSRLMLRVQKQIEGDSNLANDSHSPQIAPIPSFEMANRLQEAFFAHRWASLPFLHKPTFLGKHFFPVLQSQAQASKISLFLTYMVFALGAIDLKRQGVETAATHLDYFHTANRLYLDGLVEHDNMETVQGFLLMAMFAINEPQSMNAWMITGLAVRFSIDLGLHRKLESSGNNVLQLEIRKRIFWAAYALDRNISIALGRPFCIQDDDINVDLPLPLSDEDLLNSSSISAEASVELNDMSTFIHIVKLRQLGSTIQSIFYPADPSRTTAGELNQQRVQVRKKLEEWIVSAPRYTSPTLATFQSMEWFQIAYNHALLLLYRPSPACPNPTSQALQACADSSISLITLYLTLYSKNKITYTWIALHSLFMASVTMLYTLVDPDIRRSTNRGVVKSNINSCLSLFENMGELWPAAAQRCYSIIERLGKSTLTLFDQTSSFSRLEDHSNESSEQSGHFGEIDVNQEYMDWFGTRNHIQSEATPSSATVANAQRQPQYIPYPMEGSGLEMGDTTDLNELFQLGFDMSLPLMTNVFEHNVGSNIDFQGADRSGYVPFKNFNSDGTSGSSGGGFNNDHMAG